MVRATVVTAMFLVGCASTHSALRRRASSDLECAEPQIAITSIGARGYRAVGCGRERSYVCAGWTCAGDTDVTAARAEPEPPPPYRGDATGALVYETHGAVRGCVGASEGTITVRVEVDERGTIRPLEILERVGPHEATCVSRALHGASSPHWAGAGALTLSYEATMPPPPDAPVPEPASAETPGVQAIAAEPAPEGTAGAVRLRIDAHRAAILACAAAPVVALTVDWHVDGSIVARLRDGSGSPEEACIQSVVSGERLDPPPARAGSLLHVVEAS